MKITKLSLVAIAAMTLTTGAMAEFTADFSGDAKLWYETATDSGTVNSGNGLFHQNASGLSAGQAAISVEAKGKAGVLGYGFKYTAVDTLGLEKNLVSGIRQAGNINDDPTGLNTAHWAEKAFITYKMGNTMAKIGRQHLNTPLAFTETWNVAANSFDAAVLMNSDIENVTLIGAYVGRGNGQGRAPGGTVGGFATVAQDGQFGTYNQSGAYAAAVLAKPMKDLGANAWYYNVVDVADAVWLDADYSINGIKLGGIYAQMMPKGVAGNGDDTQAVAVRAGTKVGAVSLFGAYSQISTKGSIPVANTATNFKKTKLPTQGVYNDGLVVAQPGAKSFKLRAAMPVSNFKLTAQYISATNDKTPTIDADEFDFIVGTKIADVNVKAIYVNRTFKNSNNTATGTVGNSDANHVRIIAGINF